jgi:GNAT superfamily N-acetyltransferase
MRELAALPRDGRGEIFAARQGRRLAGLAAYADLPWETRLFGKQMGAIKCLIAEPESSCRTEIAGLLLRHVAGWAAGRGCEFLLCKPYADDLLSIHALEANGFLLMDTMLDYVYDSRECPLRRIPRPPLPEGFTIRPAGRGDEEALAAVARASFGRHFGRFHADERIPKSQATEVYVEWIRSCCRGYADWVLVAEHKGSLAGYSAWKRPAALEARHKIQVGHYSIGAVHPDFYGCGLFSALTYEGMRLFDGAARYIEGPTHLGNHGVQRGYARLSWRMCDARHSFHRWLNAT